MEPYTKFLSIVKNPTLALDMIIVQFALDVLLLGTISKTRIGFAYIHS